MKMNGFKSEAEKHQEKEINRTGGLVREARVAQSGANAALKDNSSKILGYREVIAKNNMELDILGDPSELNSTLQKKVIDLKDSNKNHELFITGAEKEVPTLNHAVTMADATFNRTQNDYRDAQNMGQDSDGITSNERQKLEAMSMVKMPMAEKMKWVNRLGGGEVGLKKLQEIVPVI